VGRETVLKLCTKVASATFLLALMPTFEARAERLLPPCPVDINTPWRDCHGTWTEPNGGTYVGEFKDGKYNGQGTLTLPDGIKYVGEFKDGKLNGQGTRTKPDGRKYVGEFKDGKLNGLGTHTWPDGTTHVGEYIGDLPNGQGTLTFPDGAKYVGEFKDGKRNGQGTLTLSDGAKYVGEFKDGKRNGQGTYTFPNGESFVGEYRDGKRNGQGTNTWPNGEKYVGEYRDGVPNGQGTLTAPNGEKYVGEFKDGKRNGQGTITWLNGEKYVGEWKDNKRNGRGTRYSSDGTVNQFGVWKDDILVVSFAENSSNKAITSALGLLEKTDGYLPLILLAIAPITAIAAIFLMKDRTEPSIRVSSPKAPETELEDAQRPQLIALLENLYDGFLKMNYQEKVLYVAASVIALMLIFPPTNKFDSYGHLTTSYDYIFSLPDRVFINIQVLLIQWLGVSLIAAILYFAASKKKNKVSN
jgi:hypothetical protein